MATDSEHSAQPATPGRSIDEVQELIGRVEEMLATLEEWGDENSERLRRKLNENVNRARDNLIHTENRSSNGARRVLRPTFTAVSIASLSGFVVGLLVASPERIGEGLSAGVRRKVGVSRRKHSSVRPS